MEIESLKVEKFMEDIFDLIYPIGSYYETSDTNFNPNSSWKGTWTRMRDGMVLVSESSGSSAGHGAPVWNVGDTDGEYWHTLTVEEIPSHRHKNNSIYGTTPGTGTTTGVAVSGGTGTVNWWANDAGETGGGQQHNNIQPSLCVARWHRTA